MAMFVGLGRLGAAATAAASARTRHPSYVESVGGQQRRPGRHGSHRLASDRTENVSSSEDDELLDEIPEDGYIELHPGSENTVFLRFNISGRRFQIASDILDRAPDGSILRNLQSNVWFLNSRAHEYILDRNPSVFQAVLEYLRTYQLHLPSGMCRSFFAQELEFYGLHENLISHCCRQKLSKREQRRLERRMARARLIQSRWRNAARRALAKHRLDTGQVDPSGMLFALAAGTTRTPTSALGWFRFRVWGITDLGGWEPSHPRFRMSVLLSNAVTILSVLFVLLAIVSFCLETLPENRLRDQRTCNPPNSTAPEDCSVEQVSYENDDFGLIELICVIYFTVEVGIRLLVCPSLRKFLLDFMNIVDFAAIIPYYVILAVGSGMSVAAVVRVLRLFRVFRVLKLGRHFTGLQILGITIQQSWRELLVIVLLICINMTLFSSAIFFAEREYDRSFFNSIPTAMWWAIVTMTTVGYGDLYPISPWGKVIAAAAAISGVLTLALPMPVFVNRFTELYLADKERRAQEARRRREIAILAERERRREAFRAEQQSKVALYLGRPTPPAGFAS